MSKPRLNKEEKEILRAFETGELKSNLTKKRKKEVEAAAETIFKKRQTIKS